MEGGRKTKMTTKWNLIHLDLVPPSDKYSEEEGDGKLFFWEVFGPHLPPRLKRQRDVWVLMMLLH